MKKVSKKLVAGLLGACMLLALAGCNTEGDVSKPLSDDTEFDTQVVATLDGKAITRGEVGEELRTSEKTAISTYLQTQMLETFFKDVEVTDEDVNLQLALIKKQVGEENWPMYLAYYGGGSEESFSNILKQNIKQEKKIAEKSETIELSEIELKELYESDTASFDIAILDVIFFDTEEDLIKATELVGSGKTLDEIATSMNKTISEKEHTYFNMEGWNKNLSDATIGELMFTTVESGNFVVGEVVELNRGLDNKIVYDDMLKTIKMERAFEDLESEFTEFLKSKDVTILGESFNLYQEESDSSIEDVLPEDVADSPIEDVLPQDEADSSTEDVSPQDDVNSPTEDVLPQE